jgi:hypothetical protein
MYQEKIFSNSKSNRLTKPEGYCPNVRENITDGKGIEHEVVELRQFLDGKTEAKSQTC